MLELSVPRTRQATLPSSGCDLLSVEMQVTTVCRTVRCRVIQKIKCSRSGKLYYN